MITFLAFAHMLNATQLVWGGGGMILAFAHMLNATQLVWGGGDDNVPCTCTHVECYATGLGWSGHTSSVELAMASGSTSPPTPESAPISVLDSPHLKSLQPVLEIEMPKTLDNLRRDGA